jgi:DNA repair exonuclease SbcCD ATPase subunit
MRINRIELRNVRNHQNTVLELDRLNIITGRNGAGKSSILYALEAALTGRCAVTDRAGRGLGDLVSVGRKGAKISIQIQAGKETYYIERSITATGGSTLKVDDWSGGAKAQQAELMARLGADPDTISCLLGVSAFLSMPEKDQREMLVRLAGAKATAGELQEWMGDELFSAWQEVVGPIDGATPETLKDWWRTAYDARARAKRELAAAEGRLAGLAELSHSDDLPDPTELPELEAQLTQLEEELRLAYEAKDARLWRERIEEELAETNRRQIILLAELEEAGAETQEVDLDGIKTRLEEARQTQRAAADTAADLAAQIRGLDAAIEAVQEASGACPLAPEHISCPLSGDDLKDLKKELEAKRRKLVRAHERAQKETSNASVRATELEDELKAAQARAEAAGRRDEAAAKLEDLEATIQRLEKELAELPAPEGDPVGIDILRERISRSRDIIARAQAVQEAREKQAEAEAQAEALRVEVNKYEALVALFEPQPTGIPNLMLKRTLDSISLQVSGALEAMTGGTYSVAIEPEPWRITVHNGRDTVEVRHLSASERFRVGVAFSVVLSRMAGLGILVIDDAEVLDRENRSLLSAYLDDLDFETVILLATRDDKPIPLDFQPEDVRLFWVEDGRVACLEPAAA